VRYPRITTGGFPHSEIPGSTLVRQLPEAYRSHQRPSSAPGTKAFTVCPCSLDHDSPSFENTTSTAVQFSRYRRDASRSERPTREPNRLADRLERRSVGLSKLNSMRPATLASGLSSPCRYRFQASLTADHGAEAPEPRPRRTRRLAGTPAVINGHRIPRKEVIQPQLPLRLPCYDFTPVTNSTFDRSLPCGLGHGLRVSPASVV
jgi:hypothetical protein